VVRGRSVHASSRLDGVDAIEKYLLVHSALRRLEAERNRDAHPLMAEYRLPYPLSVGTLQAGDWASTVPDRVVAEGRLGVAIGEGVDEARASLEQAVAAVSARDPWLREHPVEVEWWGGQFAPGLVEPDAPVSRLVSAAHTAVHGTVPAVLGAPYGSDQRLLTGLGGIPTVLYGPATCVTRTRRRGRRGRRDGRRDQDPGPAGGDRVRRPLVGRREGSTSQARPRSSRSSHDGFGRSRCGLARQGGG
jgi:acetylornithine deacetylase